MSYSNARVALQQYRRVGTQSAVEGASPHRLITMLLDGALSRLSAAAGHLERGALDKKGEQLSLAMPIVAGLRGSLDMEKGGEIARNLDALYDYCLRRLVDANVRNDAAAIEEVHALLSQVKDGWDAIGPKRDPSAATEPGRTAASV